MVDQIKSQQFRVEMRFFSVGLAASLACPLSYLRPMLRRSSRKKKKRKRKGKRRENKRKRKGKRRENKRKKRRKNRRTTEGRTKERTELKNKEKKERPRAGARASLPPCAGLAAAVDPRGLERLRRHMLNKGD